MTSCSRVEFNNQNFMRQYIVGSIFQLVSLGAAFGITYRYFGLLPLYVPLAYFFNWLLGLRAVTFKAEKAILVYVFTSSLLYSLPFTFLVKYLVTNFASAKSFELGVAHLISEILDSYGLGTPLRCKYFLLGLTVFIFTLCFSLQIFLLVISKRIRLQILSTPAPVTVHDVDEIELQDYKAPHHAQPEVHNGYMPVSQVPVYVDAQGNVVQH